MPLQKRSERIIVAFGKKVRQERLRLWLSQEAFARKAEIHRTYVGLIERGETNITITNIEKIAKGLNLSVTELLDVKK